MLVIWGPPSLGTCHLMCQFSSCVTMIYSFFHGPHRAYSVWQRHRVTLVQSIRDESPLHPWSLFCVPLYHIIVFHPYFDTVHPILPILSSSHTVCIPSRVESVAARSTMHFMLWQGKSFVCPSVPFSPFSLVSVHHSHYYFPLFLSWGSSLPHLSRALFCQHQLIYSIRTA